MKIKEIYMYVLGALITIGYFGILVYLLVSEAGTKYDTTISLMVGTLVAAFGAVYGYFYGSSKGSSDKSEIIKELKTNNDTN